MGTRSLIHVLESKDSKAPICTIYQQYDGQPDGVGSDIFNILNEGKLKIVNGFALGDSIPTVFNGMGCLAAFLIGKLKGDKIGNVYLHKPDITAEQEYNYSLYPIGTVLYLRIQAGSGLLSEGKLADFVPFVDDEDE